MIFSSFSFSEVALSDIKLQIREFWFDIVPTGTESWNVITAPVYGTSLVAENPASSFSEISFSQSPLSGLGLTLKRETWSQIKFNSTESWTDVSPSGTETWSTISPSGDESWVDVRTRII